MNPNASKNIAAGVLPESAGARFDAEYVASPCTRVCRINGDTGWCEGCLRRLEEIGGWSAMDADERRAVLARVAQRRLAWDARQERG